MPWKIKAKKVGYREEEGVYDAEGDVVISKGGVTLYAQKVTYWMKTGIAEVEGLFHLKTAEDELSGEGGVFDFENQTGKVVNGSLFIKENHFYAKGDLMEKLGENTYRLKNAVVTTCDGDNPAWSITGSEVKVTVEGYGVIKHAAFRLRSVPLLYVPYMTFSAKTKRQTGLLPPSLGYSSSNGMEVEVPFFWAISDQMDATFYQHYLSNRGYMQGLEFRHMSGPESRGAFLFDILSDQEDKDLNDPDDAKFSPLPRTNQTRYWLRGRADQVLPPGLTARLDADYVSDQDYLNEFERGGFGFESRPDLAEESRRPVEEKRSPIRTSALRVSRDRENYSLQGLASYSQLPGNPIRHETAEPLGGLLFSLLPSAVNGMPAFFTLESDYDYVWRDEGPKGHRFSIVPGLKMPLRAGPYMTFEPSIRYILNPQWFDDSQGDNENQNLRSYEAGAKMYTSLDRIWDIKILNAKKLRHRIRPTIGYTYRDYENEKYQSPWFEPVVEQGDANQLTLSIENFLDARIEDAAGNVFNRQWAKLTLAQGYNIEEERKEVRPGEDREPFEPLNAELTVTPFSKINLFAETKWDHYDQEITYFDLSLALRINRSANRIDRFHLSYQYTENNIKNINLWFNVNLIHGLSAGSSWARDLELRENISNRYWLQYQRQCWSFRLTTERENDETSVMLQIQFIGLGDFRAI